jgi:hypothetical protein
MRAWIGAVMPWRAWVRPWSTITGSLFATGLALFSLVARLTWLTWLARVARVASKWRLRLGRGGSLGCSWGGSWGGIFRLVGRRVIFYCWRGVSGRGGGGGFLFGFIRFVLLLLI